MRGLVRRNVLLEQDPRRFEMQLFALLRIEKRIRRKKHQPWPALAVRPRHLGQSQMTIGIWPKPVGVIPDGSRCALRRPSLRSAPGKGGSVRSCRSRGASGSAGFGLNHLHWRTRKVSLHPGRGIGLDRDVSRLRGRNLVFTQIESRQRNRPFRNPARCLQTIAISWPSHRAKPASVFRSPPASSPVGI